MLALVSPPNLQALCQASRKRCYFLRTISKSPTLVTIFHLIFPYLSYDASNTFEVIFSWRTDLHWQLCIVIIGYLFFIYQLLLLLGWIYRGSFCFFLWGGRVYSLERVVLSHIFLSFHRARLRIFVVLLYLERLLLRNRLESVTELIHLHHFLLCFSGSILHI